MSERRDGPVRAPWAGFPALLLLALVPATAGAQAPFEVVGERALGMAGAFVAVADDATAVHWNPAGLVTGQPAGMTIGWYRSQSGNQQGPAQPGLGRAESRFTSLGTWPLGLSYGQFSTSHVVADVASGVQVHTLRTRQVGATILQTVVEGLVAGATIKYVRGDVVSVRRAAKARPKKPLTRLATSTATHAGPWTWISG